MFKEIHGKVEDLKPGDRVHFFWTAFPDGTTINGGTNILKVDFKIPSKKKLLTKKLSNEQIIKFEKLRIENKLMLVQLQLDYYKPMNIIMCRDMSVEIYRNEEQI